MYLREGVSGLGLDLLTGLDRWRSVILERGHNEPDPGSQSVLLSAMVVVPSVK